LAFLLVDVFGLSWSAVLMVVPLLPEPEPEPPKEPTPPPPPPGNLHLNLNPNLRTTKTEERPQQGENKFAILKSKYLPKKPGINLD
jgi:hypothetical protein